MVSQKSLEFENLDPILVVKARLKRKECPKNKQNKPYCITTTLSVSFRPLFLFSICIRMGLTVKFFSLFLFLLTLVPSSKQNTIMLLWFLHKYPWKCCLKMGLKIMKKGFIRDWVCRCESPIINYLFCQWCSYCSCQLLWQLKEPHIIFVAL